MLRPITRQKNSLIISIAILLLLTSLIGTSFVHSVNGQNQWEALFAPNPFPNISIYNNGTISTTDLPIERVDNLYYLTGDIYNYAIHIDCDNIILDGRNFTLKSNGSFSGVAISISALNVTIKNIVIDTVHVAISLYGASGNMGEGMEISIINNTIRNCNVAIKCWGPSANSFRENVLENNEIAIQIKGSYFSNGQYFSRGYACFNSVEKNIIRYNDEGLHIEDANQSSIRFNLIAQNGYGAYLNDVEGTVFEANEFTDNTYGIHIIAPSSSNQFYQNNFENNSETVTLQGQDQLNYWDDGSKGNYWSDYNGTGVYKIDENNTDYYPHSQPVNVNSIARSELDNPTQNLIETQTIIAIVTVVVIATAIVSILLLRRHRKTANLIQ